MAKLKINANPYRWTSVVEYPTKLNYCNQFTMRKGETLNCKHSHYGIMFSEDLSLSRFYDFRRHGIFMFSHSHLLTALVVVCCVCFCCFRSYFFSASCADEKIFANLVSSKHEENFNGTQNSSGIRNVYRVNAISCVARITWFKQHQNYGIGTSYLKLETKTGRLI